MLKDLTKFLNERYEKDVPILLAFSGGPDSLALLHLLLAFKQTHPLNLALAHVDHGWRVESAKEVEEIAQMAEKLKLHLHVKKLDPQQMEGNLEAACRDARLQFFASLCKEHGYQAVLLAHHSDDLAETVLKRTFEGVTLPYLSSLRGEVVIYGMKVWRPLLGVSKAEILDWLNQKGLKGFDDKTNRDPKFLRAKFRTQVLPYLSEMFGKEVSSGLCHVAEEAGELRDYLDSQIKTYLDEYIDGNLGAFLDLSEKKPGSLFELKYLIRQFCKRSSFILSRKCVSQVAQLISQKVANKSFIVGRDTNVQILYIDRGRLFIPSRSPPSLPDHPLKITEGKVQLFGGWKVHMAAYHALKSEKPTDWLSLWSFGKGTVVLPKGAYSLAAPDSSLAKFWTDNKVPAFLRQSIPLVLKESVVAHEFLSGKLKSANQELQGDFVKLSISFE